MLLLPEAKKKGAPSKVIVLQFSGKQNLVSQSFCVTRNERNERFCGE